MVRLELQGKHGATPLVGGLLEEWQALGAFALDASLFAAGAGQGARLVTLSPEAGPLLALQVGSGVGCGLVFRWHGAFRSSGFLCPCLQGPFPLTCSSS